MRSGLLRRPSVAQARAARHAKGGSRGRTTKEGGRMLLCGGPVQACGASVAISAGWMPQTCVRKAFERVGTPRGKRSFPKTALIFNRVPKVASIFNHVPKTSYDREF